MTTNTGTLVIAPIRPYDSADTYPTHEDIYGKGGWMSVSTIAERDAITAERKKVGMVVLVADSGSGQPQAYRLDASGEFVVFDVAAAEAAASAAAAAQSALEAGMDANEAMQDAAQTAADRIQTGLDRTQTGLDKAQTAISAAAAASSASAAARS